jgi:hydrogenase expression/formation protein HypD
MVIAEARRKGLKNFSALVSHVLVPPAMTFLLDMADNRVQGFLGPGHVCTVMGTRAYEPIAARYQVPIVVTGFEPVDLLEGILRAVRQLESKKAEVEVQYARVVRPDGNPAARALIDRVFQVCDRSFRGIGEIPSSGLRLHDDFADLDAEHRFSVSAIAPREPAECIAGEVLKGVKKPGECPAFGNRCTPDTPLGATMVSGEGACAAYFSYARTRHPKGLPIAQTENRG